MIPITFYLLNIGLNAVSRNQIFQEILTKITMDPHMKQLQDSLVEIETEAEHLLLARHQVNVTFLFKACSS